ncbi:unnamed protein product [Durusdinium trenchii]|uniref:Pentatricopeptide repeat-containing protein n=1 Tax=Durusdinium trenchii TaxID=1381693 RepID=A0ABP0J9R7_9DINO
MAAKEGLQRLLAASEAGRVLEAQQIFHELQGHLPGKRFVQPFLWNVVLKASVKAKDWPSAEAWFRQIPARSRSPRSYGKLINCAAQDLRAGGPKQAEAVLRQAERACVTLDAFFYGALLDGCAAAGEPGRATAWMQRLQAHQLYSSVRALTAVARSCAAQGEAEEATAWMEGTEEEDKSMLRLQATAIVAPDEAVQELQKMQQTGRNIHEHSYGAAIRALAQQSDTQGARQLLRQKPTPHNFTTVIGACAKRKEFRVAILLLAEMLEAGLEMELCTWAALLSQTPLAVRWVEDMRHYQLQPDEVIYGAAIAAVARTKEADEALKMLHSMRSEQLVPNAVAYTAVIAGYARQAKVTEAELLLGEMQQESLAADEVTYSALVGAYARRGDLENSKRLVSDMALSKLRPNVVTWTALLTACAVAKPKKREESQRIFRQMVRCNVMPNETTLKTLTWVSWHSDDPGPIDG